MEITKKQVIYYVTCDGKCPYLDWLSSLDAMTKDIVNNRVERLQVGLKGDWKRLANSKLSELRISYGQGYRVYYRELNFLIILIVAGGDKSNQKRMINRANNYLKDFEERNHDEY